MCGGVEVQLHSLTSALDWLSDPLTGRNTPREEPPISTEYKDQWVHSRFGSSGDGTNLPPLLGTEFPFLRRPAGNIVTILTELPRFPKSVVNSPKPTY